MKGQCLGLDIGTTNIKAYVQGRGVVVSQPALVACDAFTGKVLAMGRQAEEMVGRHPSSIALHRPFVEGVTADVELTQSLIGAFIDRYCAGAVLKPNIVVSVPSEMTSLEQKTILDCLFSAGVARACLLPKPFAAAVGAQIQMKKPGGVMVVDIGGGATESSVLSMEEIVTCRTEKVGSDELTSDIVRYLSHDRNILVGYETAEQIKRKIGTAIKRDEVLSLILPGVDGTTGAVIYFEITSTEVYFAIKENIHRIINSIRMCWSETEPELLSDLKDNGITLTGGGSRLFGLDRLIERKTGVPVRLADEPEESVVRGLAVVARNINKFRDEGFAPRYLVWQNDVDR